MLPTHRGAVRLFRFSGIDVYLHWSWFVVALLEINMRGRQYGSPVWNVAEYLSLFAIVLAHEFGHALACRQTGGQADKIVLWPLGGVAYVAPPQRPGATLWTIAAGPLVNMVLLPIAVGLVLASQALGWETTAPDFARFIFGLAVINGALLAFNLLPIYPLDGGQILRALLWFFLGRARSLLVATVIGLIGVVVVLVVVWTRFTLSVWTAIMAFFILSVCWRGLQQARVLMRLESGPTRPGFACPACGAAPPIGAFWLCRRCGIPFDTFATGAICPSCQGEYPMTTCARCGEGRPIEEWRQG
jgi:Zn-dependent protease